MRNAQVILKGNYLLTSYTSAIENTTLVLVGSDGAFPFFGRHIWVTQSFVEPCWIYVSVFQHFHYNVWNSGEDGKQRKRITGKWWEYICCIKFMLTQTIFAYEACSRMDLYITVLYQSIPFRDHWELGLRFGNICVVGIPRCLACIFMPVTNKQRGHTRLRENGALQWIVINLWSPNRYRTSVKNFDCVQEII